MTENGRMFTSIDDEGSECDKITFGDNRKGKVKGLGKIAISNDLSISNVLLVESLSYNLLSIAQLCDIDLICKFSSKDVVITSIKSDELVFKGFCYVNLYLVDFYSNDASLSTCLFTKSSKGWLWYRRLAHVGMNQLKKLMKYDLVIVLKNDIIFKKNKLYSACQASKQVGNTYPTKSVMSTSRSFKLSHMDLFSPTTYRSIGGNSYGLVVVDDYSIYTWVFFLSDKSNMFSIFKGIAKRAENKFDFKIKKIRSDNGSEFKNSKIKDYCDEKGIKYEFSTKYTPQQNGVVERKNRTLIDVARSMLSKYNVSDSFWAEAINTACHASNRLYCHRLLKKTPYELLIGRKSNMSYFLVFGCKCYILRKGTCLSKFQSKCDECFLLGYSLNSKAYRVYNQSSGLVEESCDVEFDETNGSQEEQENLDDVGNESLRIAVKNMTIGDLKSKDEDDDYPSSLFQVLPSSSSTSHKDQVNNVEGNEESNHQSVNDFSSSSTVTPPNNNNNRFGGVTTLQDNKKTKAIDI
jgi:transposase InsO family protein